MAFRVSIGMSQSGRWWWFERNPSHSDRQTLIVRCDAITVPLPVNTEFVQLHVIEPQHPESAGVTIKCPNYLPEVVPPRESPSQRPGLSQMSGLHGHIREQHLGDTGECP